jgi:TRAP transporter 4TM/12TM fusion protein
MSSHEVGKKKQEIERTAEVGPADVEATLAKYDAEFRYRPLAGRSRWLVFAVALSLSVYQLYTAGFGLLNAHVQRAVHLAFILALGFLLYPFIQRPGVRERHIPWWDLVLAALGACGGMYILVFYLDIVLRAGTPSNVDLAMGALTSLLILEGSRRILGPEMALLALGFLAYGYLGPWLPDVLAHRGYGVLEMLDYMYLTTEGIFGIALGVSATYIFLFVLFGAFLEQAGMITLFADLAMSLVGHTKGGSAKVGIISSALFGMLNGSAIANVVTIGSFTIPLMKRTGFTAQFAGAVESTASMGGQIMPPVMGAVAFIMADTLGVPYFTIAKAATIPAILYFLAVGVQVHQEAARRGLKGLPRRELPAFWKVLRERGYLLLPLAALTYLLFSGYTPLYAGFIGILLTVAIILVRAIFAAHARLPVRVLALGGALALCAFLSASRAATALLPVAWLLAWALWRPASRGPVRQMLTSLEHGTRSALGVAIACAAIGFVIGVATQTGMGAKLASAIVSLAGGNLFLCLFFTMVASIVLGTGLPTIPTYVVTAAMAAPALAQMGIPPLVSHMFVFYFGLFADLTPPVALAALAGAGIAKADPSKTAWTACKLAISGFVVPYLFVYERGLLMEGSWLQIALSSVTAFIGVTLLGAAIMGYLVAPARWWERGVLLAGSLAMIYPWSYGDALGAVCGVLIAAVQWPRRNVPVAVPSIRGQA